MSSGVGNRMGPSTAVGSLLDFAATLDRERPPGTGQITCNLLHPFSIWLRSNARDLRCLVSPVAPERKRQWLERSRAHEAVREQCARRSGEEPVYLGDRLFLYPWQHVRGGLKREPSRGVPESLCRDLWIDPPVRGRRALRYSRAGVGERSRVPSRGPSSYACSSLGSGRMGSA